MSLEVQRQSLQVSQVLPSVVFLAWARQTYICILKAVFRKQFFRLFSPHFPAWPKRHDRTEYLIVEHLTSNENMLSVTHPITQMFFFVRISNDSEPESKIQFDLCRNDGAIINEKNI
jgi:hypothetical protein